MNMDTIDNETDRQILEALCCLNLYDKRKDKGDDIGAIALLEQNLERFLELYREHSGIAYLTNQVLFNPDVAHFFSISLEEVHRLWENEGMQRAMAKAIRQGDSLLAGALNSLSGNPISCRKTSILISAELEVRYQ